MTSSSIATPAPGLSLFLQIIHHYIFMRELSYVVNSTIPTTVVQLATVRALLNEQEDQEKMSSPGCFRTGAGHYGRMRTEVRGAGLEARQV